MLEPNRPQAPARPDIGGVARRRGASDTLLHVVDWGLGAVLLVSPWFMGGRHPLGQLVLVSLVVVVATAWALRRWMGRDGRPITWTGAELLLLAGAALVVLQIIPLPQAVLGVLSPHSADMLPLWQADSGGPAAMGAWSTVSLTPTATRAGLVMYLAYLLLFWVVVQRVGELGDVTRLLKIIAFATTLFASVGILQYLAGNGKFLWVYQHPLRDTYNVVMGPFSNKNHFAHLLALGIGPLLWFTYQAIRRESPNKRVVSWGSQHDGPVRSLAPVACMIALALVLFASLMSTSRGGIAMVLLAVSFTVILLYRRNILSRNSLAGLVVMALLMGGALGIHGYRKVADRLDDYATGTLDGLDQAGARRLIWAADYRAATDYAVMGTGIGSHREVYPAYFPQWWPTEFTHAESGYLQLLLEGGVGAIVLLLLAFWKCGQWCVGALRHADSEQSYALTTAIVAGLIVSCLHSVFDFVWYIPSCMAFAVVLAGCAFRMYRLTASGASTGIGFWFGRARFAPGVSVVILAVCGSWMITDRFSAAMAAPHWDRYLAHAIGTSSNEPPELAREVILHELHEVVRWQPTHARAHLRLAKFLMEDFERRQQDAENAMPLGQIRDAAMRQIIGPDGSARSQFASRGELNAWLDRAVGEHRHLLDEALWHTRRALSLCPMQGVGYTYLTELCFLEGAPPAAKWDYIEQALRVRPHSPKVQAIAGTEALLLGRVETAMRYWRRAFQNGPDEREQMIDVFLTSGVPVEYVLRQFEPDLSALRTMYQQYKATAAPDQLLPLQKHYAQVAEQTARDSNPDTAARIWMDLQPVYQAMNRPAAALRSLRSAAAALPADFVIRRALAMELLEQGKFEDAEHQLRWCLSRQPTDRRLQEALGRLGLERATAPLQAAPRQAAKETQPRQAVKAVQRQRR